MSTVCFLSRSSIVPNIQVSLRIQLSFHGHYLRDLFSTCVSSRQSEEWVEDFALMNLTITISIGISFCQIATTLPLCSLSFHLMAYRF